MFKRILLLSIVAGALLANGGCNVDGLGVPEIVGTAPHTRLNRPIEPVTTYTSRVVKPRGFDNVPTLWIECETNFVKDCHGHKIDQTQRQHDFPSQSHQLIKTESGPGPTDKHEEQDD